MQDLSIDSSFDRPFLIPIISIFGITPITPLTTHIIFVALTRHAHLTLHVSLRLAKRPSVGQSSHARHGQSTHGDGSSCKN
jgi:hypothetical protein